MSRKKLVPAKKPPKSPIKSIQYDLFSQFLTNDESEISNTIELWESIPKYFFTPEQVAKLRNSTGHADPYKWEYTYNDTPCKVKIQPALIEQDDGRYKAFFPSATEEMIEEALKKCLVDQQYGIHDTQNVETWIRFTLRMLYRELALRGKTRSIREIKHSIEVMSSCIITLYNDKKEMWKGSILQDLVTVGREDYLADADAHHACRLPLFISHGINRLQYRQFNYKRLMRCNNQLTRWIYKRLINRYRQASLTNDYHFMYSDIKGSGLLQQSRETDNRKKVIAALIELSGRGVLLRYDIDSRHAGRKIVDVKYTVYPSTEFVGEQKAANKRRQDSYLAGLHSGLTFVDN